MPTDCYFSPEKKNKYMLENTDFINYMSAWADRLEQEGRYGTAHVYRFALRHLRTYCNNRPFRFSDLTPCWLSKFQTYLLERRLSWNTVSTYLRMIRAVYQRGVDQGLANYRPRLFHGVYTGSRPGHKRALHESSLKVLVSNPQSIPRLEKARQLFLLLFALRGIPFVDIAYLRSCDLQDGVLSYRRRKTGTCLRVRLEPWATSLLRHFQSTDSSSPFLFPFVRREGAEGYREYQNSLRMFNRDLRQLGIRYGLPNRLSSYSARHSWATLANCKNFQHELIRDAMGHSSVKVTETYFKCHTDEQIDKMNKELLNMLFLSDRRKES